MDICTLITKVQPNPGHPGYILVAHESVYNPGNPISLLSEFQVRNHGCVIDSVSKHHHLNTSGEKGTQTFYPKDDVQIPLELMKGLMGFIISEPSHEDETNLPHITITSDHPWHPKHIADDDEAIAFTSTLSPSTTSTLYGINDVIPEQDLLSYDPSDANIHPPFGNHVECNFLACSVLNSSTQASWHRTSFHTLDAKKTPTFSCLPPSGSCQEDP